MFKKRSKRPESSQLRHKEEPKAADSSIKDDTQASGVGQGEEEEEEEEEGSMVADLLALRRLKAAERDSPGIHADKLNAGPSSTSNAGSGSSTPNNNNNNNNNAGMKRKQPSQADEAAPPEQTKESLAKKNNFTQQMNLIDVDKHMMAYIESEVKKRQRTEAQGDAPEDAGDKQQEPVDPRDALYAIDEKYRLKEGPQQEGNVTRSTAMLTAIPEVDLGIDSRLRNIEATEKAKRSLYEAEQKASAQAGPSKAQVEADTYARHRFFQHADAHHQHKLSQADMDYERDAAELLRQARVAAANRRRLGKDDLLDEAGEEEAQTEYRKKVNELKSTDDQVVARFKARQRDNSGKPAKGIVWNR